MNRKKNIHAQLVIFLLLLPLFGCSPGSLQPPTPTNSSNDWLSQTTPSASSPLPIYTPLTPTILPTLTSTPTKIILRKTATITPSPTLTIPFAEYPGEIAFTGREIGIGIIEPGGKVKTLIERCLFCYSITWSPDGENIAFEAFFEYGNTPQIFVVNIKSGKMHRITEGSRLKGYPTWSPDGKYIAYVETTYSSPGDIVLVTPDGLQTRKITYTPSDNESFPTWSPDSSQIAFVYAKDTISNVTGKESSIELWIMDRDGKNRRQIIDTPVNWTPIAFSPDGTRIAFTAGRDEWCGDLYTVEIATKIITKVENIPGCVTVPRWSPDGKFIVFLGILKKASGTKGWGQNFLIQPDGSNLSQIGPVNLGCIDITLNPIWKR